MTSDPQSSGRPNEVSQSQGSLATLGSFIFYWLLGGKGRRKYSSTHATTHMWRRWCALPTLFSTGSLVVYCRTVHVCAWGDQGPTLGDTLQEPPTLSVETVKELAKKVQQLAKGPRDPPGSASPVLGFQAVGIIPGSPTWVLEIELRFSCVRSKYSELTPRHRLLLSQRAQVNMFDGLPTLRT